MSNLTRRTALAGAAALPLLPAAALAASVSLPLLPVSAFAKPATLPAFATPADPVVTAFAEWKALDRERTRVNAVFNDMEERHGPFTPQSLAYDAETVRPVYKRTDAVERRIAEMVATTPAGLATQVRIAMERLGYDHGGGMEQVEGRLLRNMLAGAEGMAGVAS